ncbi:MAG: hypothetical protein V1873_04650 [Verrucomicrobiota bacterium]
MATILFWVSIVMLVDAAIGLWGLNYWQKLMPRVNVRLIALIEACAAAVLLLIQLWLKMRAKHPGP